MRQQADKDRKQADEDRERFAATIQQASSDVSEARYKARELEQQVSEQQKLIAQTPEGKAAAVKAGFNMPKGEEGYTHVVETKVNGEVLAEPRTRAYDPHQYDTLISKQHGYEAEIIHRSE